MDDGAAMQVQIERDMGASCLFGTKGNSKGSRHGEPWFLHSGVTGFLQAFYKRFNKCFYQSSTGVSPAFHQRFTSAQPAFYQRLTSVLFVFY